MLTAKFTDSIVELAMPGELALSCNPSYLGG